MSDTWSQTMHASRATRRRSDAVNVGEMLTAISSVTKQQRSLHGQLRSIIASSSDVKTAAQKVADIASSLINASFLSFVISRDDLPLEAIATVGNVDSAPSISFQFLQTLCLRVIERGSVTTHAIGPHDRRKVVVMPIQLNDTTSGAVVALLEPDDTPVGKRMLILELVSYALQQWDSQRATRQLDWEARTASAITELIGQIETCQSFDHACFLATNTLNEHFHANWSSIGILGSGAGVTLKTISGEAEFDLQSVLAQRTTAAMEETLIRDEITAWPPRSQDDRHAILAHRKLAALRNDEAIVSIPLKTVDGRAIGVWLSAGQQSDLHADRNVNALGTMAPYLATSLSLRRAADPGPIRAALRKIIGNDAPFGRITISVAIGVLCLLPTLPVTHRIKSTAIVEPVQHRFVTVPFDGVLRESYVRPGDAVVEGQLLAVMDDRELGWKLNGLVAEAVRAAKKQDFATATQDIHEAQIARYEKERLEQQIQVLRSRQQHLEITAALDGFVLKGDLEEVHGAPVKIGQSLFEIAPLSPLKLEVAIPEDEIAFVECGMTVNARLDGHPHERITGKIESIRPRSEIRDNRNVFVAEVILENGEQQLRPGMSGHARVLGARRTLGWVWLHKAVYRFRSALGV